MEMVGNHDNGIITAGFYRYRRKGTSIPVLPPRIPSGDTMLRNGGYYTMASAHYETTDVIEKESHVVQLDIQTEQSSFYRTLPDLLQESQLSLQEISNDEDAFVSDIVTRESSQTGTSVERTDVKNTTRHESLHRDTYNEQSEVMRITWEETILDDFVNTSPYRNFNKNCSIPDDDDENYSIVVGCDRTCSMSCRSDKNFSIPAVPDKNCSMLVDIDKKRSVLVSSDKNCSVPIGSDKDCSMSITIANDTHSSVNDTHSSGGIDSSLLTDTSIANNPTLPNYEDCIPTSERRVRERMYAVLKDNLSAHSNISLTKKPPFMGSSVTIRDLEHHLRYGISRLRILEKSPQDKRTIYPKAKSTCGDSRSLTPIDRLPRRGKKNSSAEILPHSGTTAAKFFVRAAEKLNLNSSPHRRKRRGSQNEDAPSSSSANSFSSLLHRNPPPVPSALLRRIDQKEVTGIGKVKVMLRISGENTNNPLSEDNSCTSFFNVDKKRKQITLYEPSTCATSTDMPQDRKLGIAAPKMFAFDSIFSEEDTQTEICGNALTDVLHAVINGNDGCLFCIGHSKLGKTNTMIGSAEDSTTLGMIPCAIAWLFKGINEQKQKTGTRFSVRVSALEVTVNTQQIRDLLAGHASDCEQSPSVYLRDDPLFGTVLQNQSELRATSVEKAGFYLDAALSDRTTTEESHFLYTIHVYQYNVAGKGGVAGGQSRLHLIDLVGYDRSKPSCGMSLSGLVSVLLSIFSGQRHLPNREHKITQVLKECLSSLTCHAAMIAHVSQHAQRYCETLSTVQLASRIHRMRRRRIKFTNGVNTSEENTKLTGSSDFEPSSSEQSADTVIYLGPSEETDGEHPPVHIPSLNSGDNRGAIGKVLRGSEIGSRYHHYSRNLVTSKSVPGSPQRYHDSPTHQTSSHNRSRHIKGAGFNSARSSPVRMPNKSSNKECSRIPIPNGSPSSNVEEQWIDGPRISKSKVAEGRNVHIMKTERHNNSLGKRELWVDGPMKINNHSLAPNSYGFMDSYKKNMIKNWVETQCAQLQRHKVGTVPNNIFNNTNPSNNNVNGLRKTPYKEFTVFKTLDKSDESDNGRGIASGQEEESDNEENAELVSPQLPYPHTSEVKSDVYKDNYQRCGDGIEDKDDEEMELEIIEVEEPEEPVPMQDCCLQVTEEDIALCMGTLQNPLSDIDQEHPLRVLSQENMTVVSTFTDSLSVANDLDRLFPQSREILHRYQTPKALSSQYAVNHHLPTNREHLRFLQLSKLHEIYDNKFGSKYLNGDCPRAVSRCQSVTLSEMFNNLENHTNGADFDNSSIASEPAYLSKENEKIGKFCENCKMNLISKEEMNSRNNSWFHRDLRSFGSRFHSYRHMQNMLNLRHPDGASNPNLHRDEGREPGNGAEKENRPIFDKSNSEDEDKDATMIPPPLHSKLLTLSREGFETSGVINNTCGYPYTSYITDSLPQNGTNRLLNGIYEPRSRGECYTNRANIKKLDANSNHMEKLLELKREQKQLMNELATAKQHLLHPTGKWNSDPHSYEHLEKLEQRGLHGNASTTNLDNGKKS